MTKLLKRLYREESGQGMVEYGLIIALVALAVVGGLTALNGGLNGLFTKIQTMLNDAVNPTES